MVTHNREPVKIKDVVIGDEVVTHLGNVKRIKQVHENPLGNRDLIELKVYRLMPVSVTDNHKMWAVKRGQDQTGWIAVRDLEVGDAIAIPRKNGHQIQKKDLRKIVESMRHDGFSSEILKCIDIDAKTSDTSISYPKDDYPNSMASDSLAPT